MPNKATLEQKYTAAGYPSILELKQVEGTLPTSGPRELLGDFWPEEENIDDLLATLRQWRGHANVDQAA